MDVAGGSSSLASLINSDAAFAAISQVWFELIADGGDAVDLAAGLDGCRGATPLVHLFSGIQLCDGILGAYTPAPFQDASHLVDLPRGLHSCPPEFADAAKAAPREIEGRTFGLLCRTEWASMMTGCREVLGPSLFLRKAAVATSSLRGKSLLGCLLLESSGAEEVVRVAATIMLLKATGQFGKADDVRSFLCRALPDGDAVAASPLLQEALLHLACNRNPSKGVSQPGLPSSLTSTTDDMSSGQALAITGGSSSSSSTAVPLESTLQPHGVRSEQTILADEDPLVFLASELACRIGNDELEAMLVRPSVEDGEMQCCICFENFSPQDLRHCGRPACGRTVYCLDCLRQHAETVVHDGLYAAPAVRCPSCNLRLPTKAWSSLVGEAVYDKYVQNARALLTYRCAACDETNSYFILNDGASKDPFAAFDPEARERLAESWRRFSLAEVPAEDFLQAVLVEYSCGHRCGGTPPMKVSKVFGPSGSAPWIIDLERRLVLQLAWLHRFPRQRTPCCGERFCFKCKVSSWHRGTSCQDRLQGEKARQAQSCPGCGVPTVRSEGCRKITCVCGRSWDWEGDESSEEGTFSDDASDEDEVSQAQTAINLVAMNIKASEENAKAAIAALVEARADVNQVDGTSLEAPLLIAVQCRHVVAVDALCQHGAHITRDILDEVKTVSHQQSRRQIEELLRPQIQNDPGMKLPLWVWIQAGSEQAVEALLRNAAHDEEVGSDALIALRRCRGDEACRQRISDNVREKLGDDEFKRLEVASATKSLLLELRQAHDEERDVEVDVVRQALALGADANAREEAEDEEEDEAERGLGMAGLTLLAMNCRATTESTRSCIEALVEAKADVNIESDEASTPLLAAIRQRNVPAVSALCEASAKFTAELLDEVKCMSEASRRREVEQSLRPLFRSNMKRRLPLWLWVQEGSTVAVEALLQNASHEEQIDADVIMALQRCQGDAAAQQKISDHLRRHIGDEEFDKLARQAATRRLLQELREAHDDMRSICLDIVRESLSLGADANAQEEDSGEFDDDVGSYNLTALQLTVANTYANEDNVRDVVASLIEGKADVNMDMNDSPLLSAVQHRSTAGVQALIQFSQQDVKLTQEVLEEMKSISGAKTRHHIEDLLKPLIDKDKTLRCPLWMWVQFGTVMAVEALLRNAAHDEEVDADAFVALQRCRGSETERKQIEDRLREFVGDEDFSRLCTAAATRRLLHEAREAQNEERNLDLEVIRDALAHGANPNAREESLEDLGEEDDDDDDDDEDEGDDAEEDDEHTDAEDDDDAEEDEDDKDEVDREEED